MEAPGGRESAAPKLWLAIQSRFEDVALLGVAVERVCLHAGMPGETAYRVHLCVAEAANNAIEHSHEFDASRQVQVEVEIARADVRIQVIDRGKAMASDALTAARRRPAEYEDVASLPSRGMGLYLIQSIMDSVEYRSENGTNRLIMTKTIAPSV
jgi:serine/threonine-protein kinase RsbW